MIRCLAALALMGVPASADPVTDWIAAQPLAFRTVLAASHKDPGLRRFSDQCPADVMPAENERYGFGTQDCAEGGMAVVLCLTLCRQGDGDACFGLARSIETEMEREGAATLRFPLYMAACAAGNANGCTNAGAAAKNGSWIDDARPAAAADSTCQFRTYDASCAAGSSWGCYMLGLEWGIEGVEGVTDAARAEAAWTRACQLNPDGSACTAARRELTPD